MMDPENVGLSAERLARIRPAVEQHIGDDKIAGAVTLVARHGEVVHLESIGLMDRERNRPMQADTIFRIYSMTKPIVCTALMILYERGYFQLFDPVHAFIPAFEDLKVYAGGSGSDLEVVDPQRPVTIRDLLTHTSGLTYHFLEYGPVEAMYREAQVCSDQPLAEFVADLLTLPLAFQPGTAYRYSLAHDVVAYLVEVISGQPLDVFLCEQLFEPLGMVDTGFYVPAEKLERFAAMYGAGNVVHPTMTGTKLVDDLESGVNVLVGDPRDSLESAPHQVFRGGHGLVSTAMDYWRFCQMLLNGGELAGQRVLGRKTVELMTTNHVAPELLPFEIGDEYFLGYGYGLGMRVLMDVGQSQTVGTVGEYGWAGAASTYFWIDPEEAFIGVEMASFQPNGYYLIEPTFRVAAYQAIVD